MGVRTSPGRPRSTFVTVDEFVERLRIERAARNIELQWLAERLGTSAPNVAGFESHVRQPTLERLTVWADALGVEVPRLTPSNLTGFVQRLRLERIRRRVEQRELAEALGVNRISVLGWENGRTTPTDVNLRTWAAFFRMPVPPGVQGDASRTKSGPARRSRPSATA